MSARRELIDWVFDPLPSSGARRGGDPAEHVFKHQLDTFVREVVQNANDQREGEPSVDFTFEVLRDAGLDEFLSSLRWEGLAPHLHAAAKLPGGQRLVPALAALEKNRELMVLRVTDRKTVGLTGDEDADGSHFRALCKDVLVSHKKIASAGGSYGLGKSVLWAFSGLATVAFNSVPAQLTTHQSPPRLIARAELPSHTVSAEDFQGPGWFGRDVTRAKGRRAESVWGLTANTIGRELGIAREQLDSGTSILIVGFREPAADASPSTDELGPRIADACRRWFWPAMQFEGRALRLSVGGKPVTVENELTEAWVQRRGKRTSLDEPGDVVSIDLPFEIPARRDGTQALTGEVRLVVRLASEERQDEALGRVALFRGAGMVVKYLDLRSLIAVGRPFHAFVAAGEARQPEAPTEADRAIEHFLRLAEPPGHDEWEATNALKEGYQRGYSKALDLLFASIKQSLRKLLIATAETGTRAPDALLRRFPFGARGRPGSAPTSFHFSRVGGQLDGRRWRFAGTVRPSETGGRWSIVIGLNVLGDRGTRLDPVGIVRLELVDAPRGVTHTVREGRAFIEVPRGIDELSFSGETGEVQADRSLDLEVTGTREVQHVE